MRTVNKALGGTLLGYDSENDVAEFVVSAESVDRDGDVIEQSSLNWDDFDGNPVCMFTHELDSVPVGRWLPETRRMVKVKDPATGAEVPATVMSVQFNPHTQMGKEVSASVRDGFLGAASISFIPSESGSRNKFGGADYQGELRVTEISLCSVPSNAAATRAALLCKRLKTAIDYSPVHLAEDEMELVAKLNEEFQYAAPRLWRLELEVARLARRLDCYD